MFVLKKVPLWDEKQEGICAFCEYANVLADGEQVICNKRKNLYSASHTCKKFKFDILKKDVRRQRVPEFKKFKKEQFEL